MGNTVTFSVSGQLVLISICATVAILLAYVAILQGKISRSLSKIAESKRLSTILSIEGKNVKSVPEDFVPNKTKILEQALEVMDKWIEYYRENPSPSGYAFRILDASGWRHFVKNKNEVEDKLACLLANGDMEKVKVFLTDIVNQL